MNPVFSFTIIEPTGVGRGMYPSEFSIGVLFRVRDVSLWVKYVSGEKVCEAPTRN